MLVWKFVEQIALGFVGFGMIWVFVGAVLGLIAITIKIVTQS